MVKTERIFWKSYNKGYIQGKSQERESYNKGYIEGKVQERELNNFHAKAALVDAFLFIFIWMAIAVSYGFTPRGFIIGFVFAILACFIIDKY